MRQVFACVTRYVGLPEARQIHSVTDKRSVQSTFWPREANIDDTALRAGTTARAVRRGDEVLTGGTVSVRHVRVNDDFVPGRSLLQWHGPATIRAGGPRLEVRIR